MSVSSSPDGPNPETLETARYRARLVKFQPDRHKSLGLSENLIYHGCGIHLSCRPLGSTPFPVTPSPTGKVEITV